MEIKTARGVIRGMLHKSPKKNSTLVIIVHGYFSSDKLGPARLYVQIARAIAARGFPTFRFDFIGFGESDGEMQSVTLDSELNDGETIVSTMNKVGYSRIILLGHSFGSNLSILLAGRCSTVVKVIAISPVYEKNSQDKYLDESQVRELSSNGVVSRKGFIVNRRFIDALNKAPGFDEPKTRVPVIIIRGTLDEFYTSEAVSSVLHRFPNWRLIEIQDADHNFMEPKARADLIRSIAGELAGPIRK
jgi:pimeloyl-ACP methyl ester carboxylesterase